MNKNGNILGVLSKYTHFSFGKGRTLKAEHGIDPPMHCNNF